MVNTQTQPRFSTMPSATNRSSTCANRTSRMSGLSASASTSAPSARDAPCFSRLLACLPGLNVIRMGTLYGIAVCLASAAWIMPLTTVRRPVSRQAPWILPVSREFNGARLHRGSPLRPTKFRSNWLSPRGRRRTTTFQTVRRIFAHRKRGLWIADCSIKPTLVSGNTNLPANMIGEKASNMILANIDSGSAV